MTTILEDQIVDYIRQRGPLTGLELRKSFNEDSLVLWQTCMRSEKLAAARTSTRYLRLDRRVEGYARLSPSILREFLSYSVMGLAGSSEMISRRVCEIASHIDTVSKRKHELALRIVSNVMQHICGACEYVPEMCFILAGDIAYRMANDVPRPEQSIGEFVRGSDIDLVVVLEDGASDALIGSLDNAIHREKYRTLVSPELREEVDYVIKKVSRVREQLQFDTFKHMVACKILDEGLLLFGSESLFVDIKTMLNEHGVTEKLGELERRAHTSRKEAEDYLLHADPAKAKRENLYLFYTAEESEEFE